MTRHSPLDAEHRRLGAKLVDFAGWDMPIQYAGVVGEHLAVRERVGLFDVSHLGKLVIEGPDADLDSQVPGKLPEESWKAGYNLVLNEDAGVVDDIFVYRRPDGFLLVPNAANTTAVLEQLAKGGVQPRNEGPRWAILALQGPRARGVMERVCPRAVDLKLHEFADVDMAGMLVQAARTGYTGEYGFELFVPSESAEQLWRLLLAEGQAFEISPCGLGARDTLRLEMGYPLHGHEMSAETNPLEAGLGWVVDWGKTDFTGKTRLEEFQSAGVRRRMVGLLASDRGIPRAGHSITHKGSEIGQVTSGNFSPVLGKGIALGFVPTEFGGEGTMLEVDVRGKSLPVEVVKPPFVRRGKAS